MPFAASTLDLDDSFVDAFAPTAREKIQALLIDADPLDSLELVSLAAHSRQLEIDVTACRSLEEAEDLLARRRFDVVFGEYWLGLQTSIPFIHAAALRLETPFVVVTSLDEPDIRRIAFRAGARAFLSKNSLSAQALEGVTLAVLQPRLTTLYASSFNAAAICASDAPQARRAAAAASAEAATG